MVQANLRPGQAADIAPGTGEPARQDWVCSEVLSMGRMTRVNLLIGLCAVALAAMIVAHRSAPKETSPEDKERALELVKEAGKILYPPPTDGGPPAFDPSQIADGDRQAKAIEKYTQALELWPACAEALVHRCSTRDLSGDHEGAIEDARRALDLDPEPSYYLLLAGVFEGKDAREILKRGMAKAGRNSPYYEMLWGQVPNTYFYEGDFASQARELEAICEVYGDGEFGGMHYSSLGSAYHALRDNQKAEAAFEKALPESADDLVRLRMETEEVDQVLRTIEEWKEVLDPDDALIYGAVSKALAGRSVQEIDAALEALKRQGDMNMFGVDKFSLGVLQMYQGKRGDAVLNLTEYVLWVRSNPKEWGVTLRWRAEKAQELADKIARP